ncbi:hypothetical protein BDV93DRAFT_543081 [Ceratobasidium sp. AG-I]|nr:hypothetical protein BDV93DRAFT_543081 [Ceratobasidium sp. AG-I]
MSSLAYGPMSLGIDRLPTEVLQGVLLYLTAPDIRTCRLLFRRLKEFIDSSRLLFIAELDAAGYVEAPNSRTDLDTKEKYRYLHLHQTRQRSHTISSIEIFKLGDLNGGFQTRLHSLTDKDAPRLKGGVLAKWSSVNASSYLPLQLDVVQLASLNIGSESKQWNLVFEDNINIREYDIEPACDLLVLLEYTGPALNPFNPNASPPVFDPEGLGGGTPKPYVFHFRTLSTNEPHPSAVNPSLDLGIITGDANGFWIICLGEIIVARPRCSRSEDPPFDSCSGLIVYNWTTGALLNRKDELYTYRLVVLSDQVLVMPRSSFTYGSQNTLMGELDLYYIDWSDNLNPTMTHVAVLELPFVHSIPPILAEYQNFLTLAHVAIQIGCHSNPSFSSPRPAPYARGPARIFEPVERNQLLRVRIVLPWVKSTFATGVLGADRLSNDTSIYVPYHTIFSAVRSGKNRESGVERVHWEDWAPSARWIHLEPEFREDGCSTSGAR